ncbi:testicular haploid expressed gene protein-like isoform X3 [Aquila chrysaetos chrysaetos]|uniref:testicular haploid expressed gene protein-like isoform X3 n=1 Tax=Aquila chrysaetos chrysaetos TaxID=223781 RepID=UPI001B7D2AEA|nr:testicular haploid expressed gene protein-like isoform X3 [Aquila chrysaetos chrysaetos]
MWECPPGRAAPARCGAVAARGGTWLPEMAPAVSRSLPARSRDRIRELAEPKKTACANDPRLVWGNQETIWTLSWRAVTAQPSPRTVALAKPKQDFGKNQCRSLFLYSCGRESTIWERPLLVDFGFPSDRLLKLSEPKKCQAAYLQQRPRQSPERPVSPAALSYKASPRILELARPKALHPEFLLAREVSKLAQEAIASPRTLELARAKRLHPDYVPLRDAEWPVTKAAKRTVATPRLVELAQPCRRPPMGAAQFNPDAFTVKETAKKATCSARVQELARPIKR